MSLQGARIVCNICNKIQRLHITSVGHTQPILLNAAAAVTLNQPSRNVTNKHYDPKWRKLRAKKVFRFDLPDFDKMRREANMEPSEMRKIMKKEGNLPPRTFQERDIILSSTSDVFEAYVPPEGDGVASPISKEGAKQRFTEIEKKGKSFLQLRKVRQFEEDFDTTQFADTAQDMYIKAHDLLQDIDNNEDDLHDLVTEKAYPEMTWKLERKTFRWKFVQSLEAPRVVHVRTTSLMSKDNLYAQVTVRFHTQQTLAIYDRFGRLMFGGENSPKDCLEYVVFEKHLSDEYGLWRIHAKIIPDWMPPPQPVLRTMREPEFEPIPDVEEDEGTKEVAKTSHEDEPTLATA